MGADFTKQKDVILVKDSLDSMEAFEKIIYKTIDMCYTEDFKRIEMIETFQEKKEEVRDRLIAFFKLVEEKPDRYGDHYREFVSIKREYNLHDLFATLEKLRSKK
jgi:hypothetical protein